MIKCEEPQYYLFDMTIPFHAVYGGKKLLNDFIEKPRIMKDYIIYLVIEGKIYIKQDNVCSSVEQQEMLFNLPYLPQEGYKKEKSSFYWIHFTSANNPIKITRSELINKLNNDKDFMKNRIIIPTHAKVSNYKNLVLLISLYLQELQENRNSVAEDYFLSLICAEISRQELGKILTKSNDFPFKLKEIVEYINVCSHLINSVDEVACQFGYTSKYLSFLFKKYLNTSPKKYIEDARLNHADSLLLDSNLQINKIASLVGYDDAHVFMKAYKRSRGMTPSIFRNKK